MPDISLTEYYNLLIVILLSIRNHIHKVKQGLIGEVLLLCKKDHITYRQFLELFVVDVRPIHCAYLLFEKFGRYKNKESLVIAEGKLYMPENAFVGFYDGMNLYPTFLLAHLRMLSPTYENEVGE